MSSSGVNEFNNAALFLLLILIIFYLTTRTAFFLRRPVLDLVFFVPIAVGMALVADVLAAHSGETGWPPTAVITGNTQILIPFVMISFAASTRWFACWCLFEIVLYCANIYIDVHSVKGFAIGLSGILPSLAISFYTNVALDARSRELFASMGHLNAEKDRTEGLLYNVLPKFAAERLRDGRTVADAFSEATVVFIDLVGSSALAKTLSPTHFVSILNRMFLLADRAAAEFGVEKVKTVGDAYLAITGTGHPGGAADAISFAKAVVAGIQDLAAELSLDLNVRVGVHSGPVVGGVIGEMRMAYDYWGDTMNIASRIQSAAEPGGITVSRQTFHLTRQSHGYGPPRVVLLKGIGEVEVFDAVLKSSAAGQVDIKVH
jgi:class 3 adenylate cyclase